MSQTSAIDEMERFILNVYGIHKIRAGEMLPVGVFMAEMLKNRKFKEKDFMAGMESLIQKAMIKEVNGRFFLMELGLKSIQTAEQ